MITIRSAFALFLSSLSLSQAAKLNSTQQLQYGLTMKEFDDLMVTDLTKEFGEPLTADEGENLFQKASEFALNYADNKFMNSGKDYDTATSDLYFSYVVCNSHSEILTVNDRRNELVEEMKKAGISENDVIVSTSYGANSIKRSCWIVRVPGNAFAEVLGKNPDARDFIEVHPLLPEMKIAKKTVDAAVLVLAGNKVSDLTDKANENDSLGLSLAICDGVYQFDGQEIDGDLVTKDLVDFVTNGKDVKDMSFQYYHLGGGASLYSKRMELWYNSIVKIVDNGGTGNDNSCYNAIDTHMVKAADSGLDSFAVTFDTVNSAELGFDSDDERDACIYYIIHALALHPSVCVVEPTYFSTIGPPVPSPTPSSSGVSVMLPGKVWSTSALLLAVAASAVSVL